MIATGLSEVLFVKFVSDNFYSVGYSTHHDMNSNEISAGVKYGYGHAIPVVDRSSILDLTPDCCATQHRSSKATTTIDKGIMT